MKIKGAFLPAILAAVLCINGNLWANSDGDGTAYSLDSSTDGSVVLASELIATTQNFQGGAGQTPYTLTRYGGTPAAEIVSGALRMANTTNQNNVIAFNQTGTGLCRRIVAEWDLSIVPGADGLGFALLNTARYGVSGAGPAISEEPSLEASFAVGFDIYCPDDYQSLGSHEISLHWDGVERANKWSGFDYRTGTFNRVRVVVDFVAGGAEITVSIAGNVIYNKYFLAGMTPYNCRPAFGARTGGLQTTLLIDNIAVTYETPTQAPPAPVTIRTFNQTLMNGGHRDVKQTFSFPANDTVYERVVLRLKVEQPTGGWDPWDRMMGIYLWDAGNQNRYEIARFMTPYSKAGTWWIDVTDYQSLLRGSRQMGMWVDSWVGADDPPEGYWITTDFDFYEGTPLYRVVGLRNLWVGTPTYGVLTDPTMSSFFTNKSVSVPHNAAKARLRFMVTGHGQRPNSENAAEFISRGRTAKVNSQTFYNVLWRNDCYLNPCRPQGGSWYYSRAGWAPGDRVWPWDIDISSFIVPGQSSTFGYVADAYYNNTPDSGNTARHWVESQVIFYEPYSIDPIAHWQFNEGGGTVIEDASVNQHDGALVNMNANAWTRGKHCGGLVFDGVNDYAVITGFKGVTGTASRTCSAWIKTSGSSASAVIMDWGTAGMDQKWLFGVFFTGELTVYTWPAYIKTNRTVTDNQWHHVAAVLSDDTSPNVSEIKLYVDGLLQAATTSSPQAINTAPAADVLIGAFESAGVKGGYFHGAIDEVQIYNRSVTAAEIQQLYRDQVLTGDADRDGDVDLPDFAALASLWQNTQSCDGDLTCDCAVDIDDFMVVAEEWLDVVPSN